MLFLLGNMEIELGSVYLLDHYSNTRLPASLSSIKAVFVNQKSDEHVTVVFPSFESLKNFDNLENNGLVQPNLDEHCVMALNLCKKLLTQKVSFNEFVSKRGIRRFWVHDDDDGGGEGDDHDVDDDRHLVLNGGLEVIKWGKRRRLDRQKKMSVVLPCVMQDEEESEEEKKVPECSRVLRKRKCQCKGVKYCEKKKQQQIKVISDKKFKDSQHRWTLERYKLAEKNMLRILKDKGPGPGNPILRPDLRTEARKLIGDTGLLDHLLKHMAGKLAPGGKERFQRRHNPEGAMEYWLESADLVEARKKAGVTDPYWVPPPGWKPGDCPNQDPACALQLKELKDEVDNMKRELEKLACMKKESNEASSVAPISFEESIKALKTSHAEIMKKKSHIEKQLLLVSKTFSGMEEDIGRLKESVAEGKEGEYQLLAEGVVEADKGKRRAAMNEDESLEGNEEETRIQPQKLRVPTTKSLPAAADKKENRRQKLKSGFRICKPQGTFLWPSQMGSSSSYSASSQVVVHLEDILGYPTPPSVSSSTSKPPSFIFPQPMPGLNHQQQPLSAQVKRPVASRAASILNISVATVRGSTTIGSITSPTTTCATGCSSVHAFVPDLNEAPLSSCT